MTTRTARIEREIAQERASLMANLATLEEKTHALTDWRRQVRHRPLESVGVALAGGILLAMLTDRRSRHATPDPASDGARSGRASHPLVGRFVSAFAVVAAERVVEALEDLLPTGPDIPDDIGTAPAHNGASG